ncbi:MerR family transcriptional regulator, partial [Streptococcus agalactiae]
RQHKYKKKQKSVSDAEVRRRLQDELRNQGRFSSPSQHIGNMQL